MFGSHEGNNLLTSTYKKGNRTKQEHRQKNVWFPSDIKERNKMPY